MEQWKLRQHKLNFQSDNEMQKHAWSGNAAHIEKLRLCLMQYTDLKLGNPTILHEEMKYGN